MSRILRERTAFPQCEDHVVSLGRRAGAYKGKNG